MASRLISRAGLSQQYVRRMATATSGSSSTRITVLPNGLTVATERTPHKAATVGVWADAGSRLESVNGTAHFLEHLALKHAAPAFEKLGGVLTAHTTRDQAVFAAETLGANVESSVEILADLIQHPNASQVSAERAAVRKVQAHGEALPDQVVFDHLHATAFQGESIALPVAGTPESIEAITEADVTSFHANHYTADRLVLVGAGDVDHDALVRAAESRFSQLSSSSDVAKKVPTFTGSEIRLRDDIMPTAYVALAVKGAPFLTPDYFRLAVMQTIIGSYDKSLGGASFLTSRLSKTVHDNHLADSFVSFNKGYSDTGLWGLYFASENIMQLDDFVHFMQKEWVRLSTSVTQSEVERAKQQLLAGWLINQDSTSDVARDIGSQVLKSGKRCSPEELKHHIDIISVKDIHNIANKFLWDQELAISAFGPIEGLPDYNRIRGNMSYNRF